MSDSMLGTAVLVTLVGLVFFFLIRSSTPLEWWSERFCEMRGQGLHLWSGRGGRHRDGRDNGSQTVTRVSTVRA
jgi:hypothetical protein